MANVTRERAQLLITSSFALAVLLVGIALVLNTAIYTENLATRDSDRGKDVLRLRGDVEAPISALIQHVNYNDTYDSYGHVNSEFAKELATVSDTVGKYGALDGNAVHVSAARTKGLRLEQTQKRTYTNASGGTNWTLVDGGDDIEQVRHFQMEISRSGVASTCEPFMSCFYVTVANDSESWRMSVEKLSGNVFIKVEDSDGEHECGKYDEDVTVKITEGGIQQEPIEQVTYEEEACKEAFRAVADMDGPYDVTYANGDEIEGTYELSVATNSPLSTEDNFDDQPRLTWIVYDADVRVTYRTTDLYYESTFRVVPDEE